jgi:O-phosphoseryl-tRNA(Cys) synthetase
LSCERQYFYIGDALTLLGVERITMDITMLRKVRDMWYVDYIPYCQQRHNIREWVRAIRVVKESGNWLLSKQTKRKEGV